MLYAYAIRYASLRSLRSLAAAIHYPNPYQKSQIYIKNNINTSIYIHAILNTKPKTIHQTKQNTRGLGKTKWLPLLGLRCICYIITH